MKLIEVIEVRENSNELWSTDIEGFNFLTHNRKYCVGQYCSIHNPSGHPLKDAPMNWRDDRGIMERICEHGIGHPDPDDTEYRRRNNLWDSSGSHACDGCCLV